MRIRATCCRRNWMSSAATRSTRRRLGPRVFADREAGKSTRELLHDQVVLGVRDDLLVLRELVGLDHEEPLRIGADLLVAPNRHPDVLHAGSVAAFADEVGLLGRDGEALAQLAKALVHLTEDDLVQADALSPL